MVSFLGIENLTSLTIPTVIGKPTQANSSFLQPQVTGKILANNIEKQPNNLTATHYQLLTATLDKLAFGFNYHLPETKLLQAFCTKLRYQVW
jgi:hypothetical protein